MKGSGRYARDKGGGWEKGAQGASPEERDTLSVLFVCPGAIQLKFVHTLSTNLNRDSEPRR